jgi:NAD(P)-dependent dehydrogenase (short-subunit alcohol dehydrogenase family)
MTENPFSLKGRVALVTGSSRGIGASIALALARNGADVAIHYTGQAGQARDISSQAASHGVKTAVVQGDLSGDGIPSRIVQETTAALGKIDILVLNASLQIAKNWLAITREDFEQQAAVNLRASLELLQQVVPGMTERKWGRILGIGSVQETVPHPDMLVYSSLKNAQTGMILSLAKQLAPHGITANNLAPGVILTDRNKGRLADAAYADSVLGSIPAGRFGEPQDCAGAALLLCSEAGRYITGQNLYVDGGMSL